MFKFKTKKNLTNEVEIQPNLKIFTPVEGLNLKKGLHISTGNKKVKNTLIFSVTSGLNCRTCKGKTEGTCYDLNSCNLYPNTKIAHDRNTYLSTKDNFVKNFITCLDYLSMSVTYKYARLHEGGDFYSQQYVDKIFEVVESQPNTQFLAYTKSFDLDFNNKPENLTLYNSVWGNEKEYTEQADKELPKTFVIKNEEEIPQVVEQYNLNNYFVCPATDCSKCRVCWKGEKDIIFIEHGVHIKKKKKK